MGWRERSINDIFVSGMVWGVDWIHLVGVGVGIKKTRGVIGYEKMHFCYYLSDSEGSRTKAQRLGGVVGERIE